MHPGRAIILRADARDLPLPDASVDVIITSVPYFGQRAYIDDDGTLAGQIGNEPSPQEFLEALFECTAEWWRVLREPGNAFVNIGDKRAGSGAPGTTSGLGAQVQGARSGKRSYDHDRSTEFGRPKSRMGLPERYVIGCEDGHADPAHIGWVYRQCLPWWKPNGMPESVKDRTRDDFEFWYHLTKAEQYYAAVDELRVPATTADPTDPSYRANGKSNARVKGLDAPPGQPTPNLADLPRDAVHPLGKLPGSVWRISTEPLIVPKPIRDHYQLPDHFAAFPTEWPRRLITGWCPPAVCLACGQGRYPVARITHEPYRDAGSTGRPKRQDTTGGHGGGFNDAGYPQTITTAEIVGYACACTPFTDHPERRRPTRTPLGDDATHRPVAGTGKRNTLPPLREEPVREYHLEGWAPPPTRPAVVLDPFGGTGTTALVARALGRIGIHVELSAAYNRLARWRIFESGHASKVLARTHADRQGVLL